MNWLGRRWRFETRLTPEECAARMARAIDGNFAFFGDKPVIGSVHSGGASLRKRIWIRNSFRSVLTARFRREGAVTVVECRSGMSYFTLAFMAFWCAGVLTIGGSIAGATLDPSLGGPGFEVALVPLGMLVFAFVIVAFGRWLARDEDAFLEQFLRRRLDPARGT